MSRVELAKIRALTFYKDEKTAYKRTSPLPQLVCVGKPCKLYQPEVVRCVSLGGTGTDVDWKVSLVQARSSDLPFLRGLTNADILFVFSARLICQNL